MEPSLDARVEGDRAYELVRADNSRIRHSNPCPRHADEVPALPMGSEVNTDIGPAALRCRV